MKNYALITGASKGIGKEIALQLAAKGYPVLLVARGADELSTLAAHIEKQYNIKVLWLAIDLSETGASEKVADWINTQSLKVEILVNNAGYGIWANFDSAPLEDQLNMVRLNVEALISITHLLLPVMKQLPQAYILNVASTTAYQSIPTMAVYAATKSFVLSFSRSLNFELKDSSVWVSCLSPGPTDTNFVQRAGMDALKEVAEKFNMLPVDVARIAINGMFKKKIEIIPGFMNAFGAKAVAILPKRLVERAIGKVYKVPGKSK